MTFDLAVPFPQQPADVFAWLADLRNRPLWQSSLRAVRVAGAPPYGVGTRWVDVTWPGPCPLLEVTAFDPGVRWAERGHWHGVLVDLALDFRPDHSGTEVRARMTLRADGVWRPVGWALDRLGPAAARDDLRRAARAMPVSLR